MQIIKGLAMTAVLFSSMCVSLLVYLGCFQNIGLFLVDSQSRIYQIERVVGWAAEVITADSTTWIQPQVYKYQVKRNRISNQSSGRRISHTGH